MKKIFQYIETKHLVIAALLLIIIMAGANHYYFSESRIFNFHDRFQHQFIKQQELLELRLLKLDQLLKSKGIDQLFSKNTIQQYDLDANNYMYFFIYRNDSMLFWSDNRITEAELLPAIANDNQLLQLSNGWFYSHVINSGKYRFISLLLIKNNYSIQNEYLDNSFNPSFNLPKEIQVKPKSLKTKFNILNSKGIVAFSLAFDNNYNYLGSKVILPVCFFIFWLILLLLYINLVIS